MEEDIYIICEDSRIIPSTNNNFRDNVGFFGPGENIGASWALGTTIEQQLQSMMGRGYSMSVTDFGTEVVVKIKYNNVKTGSSASATFLIKFNLNKKSGVVKANNVRYRTFTTFSEIISYIKTRANVLRQKTMSE